MRADIGYTGASSPLARAVQFSGKIMGLIFILSLAWEFALEESVLALFGVVDGHESPAEHWRYVATVMGFTFIALIYPTLALAHYFGKRDKHQAELEFLANHDVLTGLPNRNLLLDRLEFGIALAKRHEDRLCVLFIDLNDFKEVNDRYGHDAGDEFLKRTAERLSACLRESDTVARFGGDEFVAIISDIHDGAPPKKLVEKLQNEISMPTLIAADDVTVKASIGMALYPDDGATPEALLSHADKDMYGAKRKQALRVVSS